MNKTKTTKLLLASMLITGLMGGVAMAKDDSNNTIAQGTTIGHYQKPGAPVDLTYKSVKVALNEVADVNISLSTSAKSGEMAVDIDIDKNLKVEGESYDKITFSLNPNTKDYNVNLKVSSNKNGLYYIRLLVKITNNTGAKMRALAVPVYVGNGQLQRRSKQVIMKAMSGENISVSKAQETIEVIK